MLKLLINLLIITAILLPNSANAQSANQTTATSPLTTTTTKPQATNKVTTATAIQGQTQNQSIVLLGEKVGKNEEQPLNPPFPDLLGITTATLTGVVSDFTSPGMTISQTAAMIKLAKKTTVDVAIVFAGYTDEKQEIDNDKQRESLTTLVKSLKSKNPKMRIFLVPSATTIGALTNANLRLVAGDLNATYISLGTEVSGEPYREALKSIKAELSTAPEAVADQQPENQSTGKQVTINGGGIQAPTDQTTPKSYEEKKASLQRELNRIAGQADQPSAILPENSMLTTESIYTQPTGNTTTVPTYPQGGTITKRGTDAQQNINMRPLPAIKAYRPQIPVPRNHINKKEPAVSR